MRRVLFLAVVIAALATAVSASATPITLTFTTAAIPYGSPGSFGDYGSVNIGGGLNTTGYSVAISTLVVSGDGTYDATYGVTGAVYNNQYGALNWSTTPGSQSVSIVGGVPTLGVANGTTLLTGTGGSNGFTNLSVTTTNCAALGFPSFYGCFDIAFTTPDAKADSLLTALGLAGTQWSLATLDIVGGSGNNFPNYSVNAVNTAVPEPASMLLLGTGLFGLAGGMRTRLRARRK